MRTLAAVPCSLRSILAKHEDAGIDLDTIGSMKVTGTHVYEGEKCVEEWRV